MLYNKYSGYDYVTKNVSVYADKDQMQLIASGKFDATSFSTLTFDFDTPVITKELCIVCKDSYKESNTYVGLGEVEITAEQGIEQFEVRYCDWDGTLLKAECAEVSERVPIYKCYNRTQYKGRCCGSTSYRAQKIDEYIQEELRQYFERNKSSPQIRLLAKDWAKAELPAQKMILIQIIERVSIFGSMDIRVTFREFTML